MFRWDLTLTMTKTTDRRASCRNSSGTMDSSNSLARPALPLAPGRIDLQQHPSIQSHEYGYATALRAIDYQRQYHSPSRGLSDPERKIKTPNSELFPSTHTTRNRTNHVPLQSLDTIRRGTFLQTDWTSRDRLQRRGKGSLCS